MEQSCSATRMAFALGLAMSLKLACPIQIALTPHHNAHGVLQDIPTFLAFHDCTLFAKRTDLEYQHHDPSRFSR